VKSADLRVIRDGASLLQDPTEVSVWVRAKPCDSIIHSLVETRDNPTNRCKSVAFDSPQDPHAPREMDLAPWIRVCAETRFRWVSRAIGMRHTTQPAVNTCRDQTPIIQRSHTEGE